MEEYEYISTLGEGAYGYVWKCQERSTGRIVAIKGFKQAHEEPEIMRLAVREVRVLQTLHHPAVIQLIEAFKSKSGRVYMVFPYVGRSAYQELDRHPDGLPPHILKLLVWQLLQALMYLHRRKVIHRDIKPANILVSEGGDVKLCDFGFARYVRCGPHEVQRLSSYVVTRWYRAPEVLVSDLYGPAADIWSLGCTVAELATGVPLFPGKSTIDQLWRIMRCFGPLPPRLAARVSDDTRLAGVKVPPPGRTLRERLPGCEPGLLRLVEACLATDPNVRPTAEELLQLPYFWVVPRLLAGTPLESVYDRVLQGPGGGGGVAKGTMPAAAASERERLPLHSGGNETRAGDRAAAPPPLVLPPSVRTTGSAGPPLLGSSASGGGGVSNNAVPPSMPPTPDMLAPEQRPGQQSGAVPSTVVSSTTPAAAASDAVSDSSNSSLLPMSPTDLGSPEHLECASSNCSTEANRDDQEDAEEEGEGSVYDSRSSCTTSSSSETECSPRPSRHVQLRAGSPAYRHPLSRKKQTQQQRQPQYSEQSVYAQQKQLLLQRSLEQQQCQQQQKQQQSQLQQQEFQQQQTYRPQRQQRPSHRHSSQQQEQRHMHITATNAAIAAANDSDVVRTEPQPPPPLAQGLTPGLVGLANGGSIVDAHGTTCTAVSNTSAEAATASGAVVPELAPGVSEQQPVTTAAAAAAGGGSTTCTATELGFGSGIGGVEATASGAGTEVLLQVQHEIGTLGGGGAGGDASGFAMGLGAGAVRSGGRTVGGATLLSTAVSAVSLAQLLDLSGPLEPSARLANMDGGVNGGSSTIVIADGMPYTAAAAACAIPNLLKPLDTTSTPAAGRHDMGGSGGNVGDGDNELSLWPQPNELLLLPHPSPPPAQSLSHQQGLVRVLTPERPPPPAPAPAAATSNTDPNVTLAAPRPTRSDSLPSARGAPSHRTTQYTHAAPLPVAMTTVGTTRSHLAGGAATDTEPSFLDNNASTPTPRFLGQSVSANCNTPFAAWPPMRYSPRASGVMSTVEAQCVEPSGPSEQASGGGAGPGSTAGGSSTNGAGSRSMGGIGALSRAALGNSLAGCRSIGLSSWGGDAVAAGVSERSPSYLMSTGMPSIAGLSNAPSCYMGSCDTATFAQLYVASPSAVVAAGPPAPNPHGGGVVTASRIQQGGAVQGMSSVTGGGSSYGYGYGYDRVMQLSVGGSPSYSSYMLKAGGSCSGYSEAALPICMTPDGTVVAKMRASAAAYSTTAQDEQVTVGTFTTAGGAVTANSSAGFRSYEHHPHVLSSDQMPPSAMEAARITAALAAPAQASPVVAVRSFRHIPAVPRESPTPTVTPRRMGASYTGMPYAPMRSLPEVDTAVTAAGVTLAHEASHSSAGFKSASGGIMSTAAAAGSVSGGPGGGDEWVLALEPGDPLAEPSALASSGPSGSTSVGALRGAGRSASRSLLLSGSNSSKVQPIPAAAYRSRSRSRFGATLPAASSGSFAIASVSVVAAGGGGGGTGADGGVSPLSGNMVRSTADGAPVGGVIAASDILRRQSSLWAVASSSLRGPPSIGEAVGSTSAAVAAIGDVYDNACTTSPSGVVLLGSRRFTRGEDGEGGLGVGWGSGGVAALSGEGDNGRQSKKKSALTKFLRVMKKALSFK